MKYLAITILMVLITSISNEKDNCCPIKNAFIKSNALQYYVENYTINIYSGGNHQDVKSIVDGKIVYCDSLKTNIKIETEKGFLSYMFMDTVYFSKNDSVYKGEIIGKMDLTLGFVQIINHNNRAIDIEKLINCCNGFGK